MPAGDRLWFRLVCRSWAAAGAGVAQVDAEGLPRGKVTRTRGADAAASVARAEMVLRVLHGPFLVKWLNEFERGICNYAAGGGAGLPGRPGESSSTRSLLYIQIRDLSGLRCKLV